MTRLTRQLGWCGLFLLLAPGLGLAQPTVTTTPIPSGKDDHGTFSFSVVPNGTTLVTAGILNLTVTALDNGGNVHSSFNGTIHFTSTDPLASLPVDTTYSSSDKGVKAFTASINTTGSQTITVLDTAVGAVTGQSPAILVTDPNPTSTYTFTAVFTETPTNTSTFTSTNSFTDLPTETPTATSTDTWSFTPTDTATFTSTNSFTDLPKDTPTPTSTDTWSSTPTDTATFTSTNSFTDLPTNTPTDTSTDTWTSTPTDTATFTSTNSFTDIPTNTPTATSTDTWSSTPTDTATFTSTNSFTDIPTNTPTATSTDTWSFTPTDTATFTSTNSFTDIPTNTPTATSTDTATFTSTNSFTDIPTNTPTATSTDTWSFTPTDTATFTSTNSFTDIPTNTPTATSTDTWSSTPTDTATFTFTNSFTDIPTNTPTATSTDTWSFTPTASSTSTSTWTNSFTATSTNTSSFTPTATNSSTNSFTFTPTSTATFTPTLCFTFTTQWGGTGKGNGVFNLPMGIAVSGPYAYVTDYLNNRVQKFDVNGGWVTTWGDGFQNSTHGQFYAPWRITSDGTGKFFVTELGNNRVQVVDAAGNSLFMIGGPGGGNGTFNAPRGCAVDGNGNLYVADTGNHLIQKFKLVGNSATFVKQWGGTGSCNLPPGTYNQGSFCTLSDIALDAVGNIYAADQGGNSVEKFDPNGNYLGQIGNSSGVDPNALAFGPDGNLYVAGQSGVSIKAFDPSGNSLYQWGGYGSGPGQFLNASGVAFDSCGDLFAVDSTGYRVEKFIPCGSTCSLFIPPTVTPTFTWTFTSTATPTATYSFTATPTPTPTYSFTSTSTATWTSTNTSTPTLTWTFTSSPTSTSTPTFTPTFIYGANWAQATGNGIFSARWGHACVVFNNLLYLIGGTNGVTNYSDVWSSPDGVNWTNVTPAAPFSGRAYLSAVVHSGKIWVIAGSGTNDVWSSSDGLNWTLVTAHAAFSARQSQSVVEFDNGSGSQLWLIGGRSASGRIATDMWKSSDGVTWTKVNALFQGQARAGHGCIVVNGKMFVLGGMDAASSNLLNDVWYTTNGSLWTLLTSSNSFSPRQFHSCFYSNGYFWVMGGIGQASGNGSPDLNDVWFSADGSNWSQATPNAAFSIRDSQAGIPFLGKMWILGGRYLANPTVTPATAYYNDIWYTPPSIGALGPADSGPMAMAAKFHGSVVDHESLPTSTATEPSALTDNRSDNLIQSLMAAPNICRGSQPVRFHMDLKSPGKVTLALYTLMGDEVYETQMEGALGPNDLIWSTQNSNGAQVASGLYIYVVRADSGIQRETRSGKVVILH